MPEHDPNEYVAMEFHGLVTDLQQNDVKRFEEEMKKDRAARAALRHQDPNHGLSAGELLRAMDGDPELRQLRIQEELAKQNKEAQAAVAEKDKLNEPLPAGHFPPPPSADG